MTSYPLFNQLQGITNELLEDDAMLAEPNSRDATAENLFFMLENGIDHPPAASPKSNGNHTNNRQQVLDTQQAATALTGISTELKKLGAFKNPELRENMLQIAKLLQTVQEDVDDQLSPVFHHQRRQLAAIASKMHQAQDLETLLQVVVRATGEILQADRVLIYRCDPTTSGKVVAEFLRHGWRPALGETLAINCFGADAPQNYVTQQTVSITDINTVELTPYQRQLLEQLQVKASLSLPILLDKQEVWGLLVVQQCSKPRQWQETEINLLNQISQELRLNLQQYEFSSKLQQQAEQEKAVVKIIDRIRQSLDIDTIFRTTTQEVRQLLKADRVAVYRFNPDWSGEFIAESVASGWVKLAGPDIKTVWEDSYLQETQGGRYRNNQTSIVDDIYKAGHSHCHIDVLEQFEVKAYMIVPVFTRQKLWGLLAAYQNSSSRHWEESEASFLTQIGNQFGSAVQLAESIRNTQLQDESKRAIAKIVDRIRQSIDFEQILKTTTQEVQQLLKADRVAVYRFNSDWSGEFIAESVASGWVKLVGSGINSLREDTHLQETQGGRFRNNETLAVDDIYKAVHFQCYLDMLEQFEVKAYVIVPIFSGQKLWGLLAAYQNSGPRHWQASEVSLLAQIATQLGIPIQQAELLSRAQQQAEREKALARVLENFRSSHEMETLFKGTTQEVRKFLKADRVAVYRFNPDWSGEVIAESVAGGWVSIMQMQDKDASLKENTTKDDRCTVKNLAAPGSAADTDTYLKDTRGGSYAKGGRFKQVNDIYTAGFSPCYIETLEKYQARAYIIVPIFQGNKLWGLLAVYQNSGPRYWQETDVSLLVEIGHQAGEALQQVEYIQHIQQQAARERTLARVVERISQALDVSSIFKAVTQEVRQLLQVDRVAVYRFNLDWSGDFIAESVTSGWVKLVGTDVGTNVRDTYLQETQGGRYRNNESLAVDDIYHAGHTPCHVEILEQFEAKAYVLVPIFSGQRLWGLLCAYQNSGPRHWEETEVNLLKQIGVQLGVPIQRAETLEQLRVQSEQLAEAAAREKAAKEQLQQRVIQMLSAVKPVFSGDLTVRVPITEDEVGTIADAYNNTIQSLRKIVMQVQSTAFKVAETSHNSEIAVVNLVEQGQQQAQELQQALEQIQAMVSSTQAVTANAQQVEAAVQQANQIVRQGDTAMNRTVDGILTIRETVSETTKKIKRLSESSQKISKVVSLISNFTTQTQLLALNAAIEATRAGAYGRGFAVVADEVRSLARQSAEATTEIEKLVQEIQAETSAVSVAMDTGIQQVVNGTNLVNDTRQSLNEIVTATALISQLVQSITQATQAQAQQSEVATQVMTEVATITNKTATDSVQISNSFQELLATAQQLQASVGQFKVN